MPKADNDKNELFVQYIIPVSVAVGVVLAAITIGCVCYKRWRLALKIKKQKVAEAESAAKKASNVSESGDEESSKKHTIPTEEALIKGED